jgi:hypothetical protein
MKNKTSIYLPNMNIFKIWASFKPLFICQKFAIYKFYRKTRIIRHEPSSKQMGIHVMPNLLKFIWKSSSQEPLWLKWSFGACLLKSFDNMMLLLFNNNTTGAISRTGTSYPSRPPEFTLDFCKSLCCSILRFPCIVLYIIVCYPLSLVAVTKNRNFL